jgi:hypothetical protein
MNDRTQITDSVGEPRTTDSIAAESIATGWRRHPLTRRDFLLAIALAIVALMVRWPFIARGETLLNSDEAIVGLMAQDIAEGSRFPIYFYGQRYMGALEAYVIAAVRPLCDDPITALRLGPACFFAVLVAVQFLMLTRWFGRVGGLTGAVALLAASPMFVQWSISARGGYIEILVWGSLLWWAYFEWFVAPRPESHGAIRQATIGLLVGSGLWINPMIVIFLVPIALHALLSQVESPNGRGSAAAIIRRVAACFGNRPIALPAVAFIALVLLNGVWSVRLHGARAEHVLLLGIVPRAAAVGILACVGFAGACWIARRTNAASILRRQITHAGPFILGTLIGNAPSAVYVVQQTMMGRAFEDTLPLGVRPIWTIGENLNFLFHGAPVVFGADPAPFLDLVRVGRSYTTLPLAGPVTASLAASNWLVLFGLVACGVLLIVGFRAELLALLRLKPGPHSPVGLLILALTGLVGLYVTSGCTVDFTSIRYLVPLWAIVPGLLGAVASLRKNRPASLVSVMVVLLAWSAGQLAMFAQIGPPQVLSSLARALESRRLEFALAEPIDAHMLSFLTQQRTRIGEYQSCWPRLVHYRTELDPQSPITYIVHATDADWTGDWTRSGWPGPPPPETTRFLWPALKQTLRDQPSDVLSREYLTEGYELWVLARPLPERKPGDAFELTASNNEKRTSFGVAASNTVSQETD